ncbi:MAG: ATP synthase F1 subunit epsilon [Oscillospiraceae bacterium]
MNSFHLDIVTPDGTFFDGEAEKVLVRTIVGDVCILARHTEYVTALGLGQAKVVVDDVPRKAACMGGMLTVSGGKVKIVATTFEWAEDIDLDRAQKAKLRAEEILANKTDDKSAQLAEARLKRALVRIGTLE